MTPRPITLSVGVLVAAVVVLGHVPAPAVAASPDIMTLTGVLTAANRDWGGERTFVVPSGTSAIDIDLTCPGGEPVTCGRRTLGNAHTPACLPHKSLSVLVFSHVQVWHGSCKR